MNLIKRIPNNIRVGDIVRLRPDIDQEHLNIIGIMDQDFCINGQNHDFETFRKAALKVSYIDPHRIMLEDLSIIWPPGFFSLVSFKRRLDNKPDWRAP